MLPATLGFKFFGSNIRKRKYSPATTAVAATVSRSGYPPLDSEMGLTGELWSNRLVLILIRIGREIRCLLYAEFFFLKKKKEKIS